MTKAEIDRVVLEVYQNYPKMNEDLRSEVIVWLMENGSSYPRGSSIDYLVLEARTALGDRITASQDAVDVSIRRESRGLDNYYGHSYNESEEEDG